MNLADRLAGVRSHLLEIAFSMLIKIGLVPALGPALSLVILEIRLTPRRCFIAAMSASRYISSATLAGSSDTHMHRVHHDRGR